MTDLGKEAAALLEQAEPLMLCYTDHDHDVVPWLERARALRARIRAEAAGAPEPCGVCDGRGRLNTRGGGDIACDPCEGTGRAPADYHEAFFGPGAEYAPEPTAPLRTRADVDAELVRVVRSATESDWIKWGLRGVAELVAETTRPDAPPAVRAASEEAERAVLDQLKLVHVHQLADGTPVFSSSWDAREAARIVLARRAAARGTEGKP